MIKVLIVDEIPLISDMLAETLEKEPDFKVVGCVKTEKEALELLPKCNLVLVSTTTPNEAALPVICSLIKADASVRVVVVGVAESEEAILPYVEAGVAGYVLKDDSVDELLQKIRAIHRGEAPVSPQIAAALMERVAELRESCDELVSPEGPGALTPREREVLELLKQTVSNQEIADRLVIELGTVKNHVHNILKKLNLSSRRDVARVRVEQGEK